MFGYEGDGLWRWLSWMGLLKDGGNNGIGYRTWGSWKGLMSRMGLVWICSMDSPWEVSALEVKLESDEGKFSYASLGDDGLVEDMDIDWRLIFWEDIRSVDVKFCQSTCDVVEEPFVFGFDVGWIVHC